MRARPKFDVRPTQRLFRRAGRSLGRALSVAVLLVAGACGAGLQQQTIDLSRIGADGGTGVPVDHLPPARACLSQAPAPRSLRRLTTTEINNSVADLLGAGAPQTTSLFNNDPTTYGLHDVYSNLQVRDFAATNVETFAEACAFFASTHLSAVSPCTTLDAACANSFVIAFGSRAFRQPLPAELVAPYVGLYTSASDVPGAISAVVSAMLQSPYFLYRSELGVQAGNGFALTPYEVASELSYTYTASMPDATLMQAAAQNALQTPAQLSAQAARLLATPRGHSAAQEFFLEWLQVSELSNLSRMETLGTVATTLDDVTKAEMLTEARMLIDDVVYSRRGSFADLLTTNYSFVNQHLATFYGGSGGSGANFTSTPTQGLQRAPGVLGLGGVIAAASQATYASPTLRGRMVRMRLLCDPLGAPPPGVPALDASKPNQTLRQRFAAHVSNSACASCHTLMDPLGFTFGDYDTLGRIRVGNLEQGQPVDTSGEVATPDDGSSTPVADLAAMATVLSTSPQAQACMGRNWAMYALGSVSWDQDSCTYDAVAKVGAANNFNLQQTLIGLTQVPSFTQRVMDP